LLILLQLKRIPKQISCYVFNKTRPPWAS